MHLPKEDQDQKLVPDHAVEHQLLWDRREREGGRARDENTAGFDPHQIYTGIVIEWPGYGDWCCQGPPTLREHLAREHAEVNICLFCTSFLICLDLEDEMACQGGACYSQCCRLRQGGE